MTETAEKIVNGLGLTESEVFSIIHDECEDVKVVDLGCSDSDDAHIEITTRILVNSQIYSIIWYRGVPPVDSNEYYKQVARKLPADKNQSCGGKHAESCKSV